VSGIPLAYFLPAGIGGAQCPNSDEQAAKCFQRAAGKMVMTVYRGR
jgi:hypothetical protein